MKKQLEVINSLLGEAEENQSETQTPTAGERPTGEFGRAINDKSEVVYPAQKRTKGRPKGGCGNIRRRVLCIVDLSPALLFSYINFVI